MPRPGSNIGTLSNYLYSNLYATLSQDRISVVADPEDGSRFQLWSFEEAVGGPISIQRIRSLGIPGLFLGVKGPSQPDADIVALPNLTFWGVKKVTEGGNETDRIKILYFGRENATNAYLALSLSYGVNGTQLQLAPEQDGVGNQEWRFTNENSFKN